ncbi:hypothetical protein LHL20_07595 [Alteromonas sp. McT4-15]|uniref:hypothetical protein n=1 Tax=Alteromonas sp. McT4-15 TaxID=2881256 RepID=UPI001CF80D53|nr:hypothetical protein [Alteromonas sp. McT4-15]MCB4436099.1 hypothetical protein [Alteromonas sp. McT4-15]
MKNAFCITLCAWLFSTCISISQAKEADEIIYTRAFADSDYGHYHIAVLQAALNITPELGTTSIAPHPHPMSQSRQLVSLINGDADIMWSVTNRTREQKLIAIKLPLLKGFAGHRVLVINPKRQLDFPLHIDINQLKSMTLVQGNDWPDLEILEHNGYTVSGEDWSLWFQSMFSMVERDLVDGFPRNVIEVHRDLARHADKNIILEKNHILRYPSYEYFFVSPQNSALANRLRIGLIRLLENGELSALFEAQEGHEHAALIVDSPSRTTHTLKNPAIPYVLDYAQWDKHASSAIKALHDETNSN